MNSAPPLTAVQKFWRYRIFAVTWLAYAGFYFCRKNFSVVMPLMTQESAYTKDDLALVISVFSLMYMLGQFINGYLSDQFSPRLIVGIGLLISVISNFFLGFTGSMLILTFFMGLNGLGQSSGWSGLLKNMSAWFRHEERGVVMSWWSTCYVIGAFAATLFATYWSTTELFFPELGWKRGFLAPAFLLLIIALVYVLLTRNTPKSAGLSEIVQEDTGPSNAITETNDLDKATAVKMVLRNSAVWITAAMYFLLKMTRYCFLFWLPMYLVEALGYDNGSAGYMSSIYELAGFLGILAAGYISDKLFNSRRFPVSAMMLYGLAIACLIQPYLSTLGPIATGISIGLIGLMTYGPDSLMSATGAMDMGGKQGAATAAGIINGVGSLGQLISPFAVTYFSRVYGWDGLFYLFVVLALVAGTLLTFKWKM